MKQQDLFDVLSEVKALSGNQTWSLDRRSGGWAIARLTRDDGGLTQTVAVASDLEGREALTFLRGVLAGVQSCS